MLDPNAPIVSPEAVRDHMRALVLLDCRSGPDAAARFEARHLEGAIHADLERDLSGDASRPEHGGRHPLPDLHVWAARLGELGIDPESFVVAYDDQRGANAAARAWWMLRASGHEKVAVLDGGLQAAESAGLPMESGPGRAIDEKAPYPVDRWMLPTVGIEDVDHMRTDPSRRVVDVRAPERWRGEIEPIDPIAGRIPGAINVPLGESLDASGRFKTRDALRAHFEARLGVSIDRVAVSCGSGVTACHTLLALEHAGLPGAALYVGSYGEWCRAGRPLGKGWA
jgi:thiosulfate/3-mercaptopyruvate sulfurtransferase